MSDLIIPSKGLIVGSFLYRSDLYQKEELREFWNSKIGDSFIFEHDYFPMKDYYSKEMGDQSLLSRFFIVSHSLFSRESLVDFKVWADNYEKELFPTGNRYVNLDIGFLSLENLGLATGKNFSHRVYLSQGVFFDLTLHCSQGKFVTLPWSYPDYSHPEVVEFFDWCRNYLLQKIKK